MRITGFLRLIALTFLVVSVSTAGLRPSKLPLTTRTIDVSDYVTCTGDSDATTAFNTALTAAAGNTLWVPSGCILRFGTPGGGGAVATIPSNTAILCEDQTAGFAVNRQRCTGGTYGETAPCSGVGCNGAACSSSAECTGGGTCGFDFGASVFAPTTATTYTIFKDGGATSNTQDIRIENCSFWIAQADPYQRCSGGTSAGNPCRQECDDSNSLSGQRCQSNADCTGTPNGTCLRTADCAAGGGTCTAAPKSASTVGTAKINPLDLRNTTFARLINVGIYDHFQGDFGVKTGYWATIRDTHVARELTDCGTPLATPSASMCRGAQSSSCCYGAFFSLGAGLNTQPTTSVLNGVDVGLHSQLIRVTSRGSTTAIVGTDNVRLDECTAWPPNGFGPGTSGGGYQVGATSEVAKSYALALGSGTTGISLTGANASAIENRLGGSFTTGISMTAANQHAIGNNITGIGTGISTAIGISATGNYDYIAGNYLEGNASSGAGIQTATGSYLTVQGNQIASSAVDTLETGIKIGTSFTIATDNQIERPKKAAIWLNAGTSGVGITSNRTQLAVSRVTTALQPVHVLSDSGAFNVRMTGNTFSGGWRGLRQGTNATGYNVQVIGNRFQGLAGAAVSHGGAGINMVGNYINQGFAGAGGPSLVCDATCTTGNGRGNVCQQDSDCATCNASVSKCIPEPIAGFFGNPEAVWGTEHNQWLDNLLYMGWPADTGVTLTAVKQCGGTATNPGALCTVATCAGGATCSGGPPATCQSGADVGKRCCAGAAPTCTARTPTPWLRVLDYGSASSYSDTIVATNSIFGVSGTTDNVGIDMVSSFSLPNMTISRWQVAGNQFSATSGTNTTAIKFPTDTTARTKVSGFMIGDQAFNGGWANTIQNYQYNFGSYLPQNGDIVIGGALTLGTANPTTNFFPFTGVLTANATETNAQHYISLGATIWKMTCEVSVAPGGTSVRTFTLRVNSAATAMVCTITGTAKECNTAAGAASTPITVTAGQPVDYRQVISVANAAAANGTCYALVTYNTTF